MKPEIRPGWALAAALAAVLYASPEAFAENYGRATGPHEVVTSEVSTPADVDDYVFDGAPGWQLKASVKKGKTGDLAPILELVAPNGAVEAVGSSSSKASAIKMAILATGGRYALRVRGASGAGSYTLAWALKPDKGLSVKADPVGANVTRSYPFAGTEGSLVSWTLKYKGDGGAQVVAIRDGLGGAVPFDEGAVQRKGTTEKANLIPLTGAAGTCALEVRNDFAPVAVTLKVKVKLPKQPKQRLTLNPAEPTLDSILPTSGGCSTPVSITGANLGTSVAGLRLGAAKVTGATVSGGTTIQFVAPAGAGTVDVVYTGADGQVGVLKNAFTFLAAHTVTGFDPAGGSGSGGQLLTISGTNFRTDIPGLYDVLVGGTPAPSVNVVSANTITCVTPAHVAGSFDVVVRDDCGLTAAAPGTFTYGLPPFINLITPAASPTFGGVPVLISGVNLSSADKVYFDGALVATTPFIYQGAVIGHTIPAVPAHAAGTVNVEVRATSGQSAVKVGGFAYYDFTDATAATIPAVSGGEDWGGTSTAVLDKNGDGKVDWLVVGHTDRITATRGGTRVLDVAGTGTFTDVTGSVMPAATSTESWGTNRVLAGRLTNDSASDLYISRPGTGTEAVIAADKRSVVAWGRVFHNSGSTLVVQPHESSATSALVIPGMLVCNATWACAGVNRPGVCYLFDYDFRSVNAAMGDLDGDLDQDVVLLNDVSIDRFVGVTVGTWVSCQGYSSVDYQYYIKYPYGSALRILSTGSNGGLTDRTASLLETAFTPEEDFRGVGLALTDITGDGLRDIIITHNQQVGGTSPVPATRIFRQKNTGNSVTFGQLKTALPSVSGAEDWRGDAVAAGDLNNDLRPDLIIAWNGAPLGNSQFSTRILLQTEAQGFQDVTTSVLTGVLPAGDDGRAKALVVVDFDKDGDQDIFLSTPDAVGSGNRRTRFLLNLGADPDTGRPRFMDAGAILPPANVDSGAAVALLATDIDGDGDLDLVLTDTYNNGNGSRRTRLFRQNR